MELKGASPGAAEGRFQRKALPGVSLEREGRKGAAVPQQLVVDFQQGRLTGSLLAAAISYILGFFQMTNE